VPKEADDHFGLTLQATEFTAGQAVQIGDRSRERVRHGALDEGIALLLRIELWCIGRQMGHRIVLRMCRNEGGGGARAVSIQPIPDHQQRCADLSPEEAQGQDDTAA